MRVLWLTSIVFPEARSLLCGKENEIKSTGGWMIAAANELQNNPNVSLAITSVMPGIKSIKRLHGKNVIYYLIPQNTAKKGYDYQFERYCRIIHDEFLPDVVHIHGTENPYGLAYVKACGGDNVVVSIQGLISVIADYYNYGLTKSDIYKNITLRDVFKGDLLAHQKALKKKGIFEVELLKRVSHIIGRTSWDKAHTWAINPNAYYHFCNETLRSEFYTGRWMYEKCTPFSIFVSQASYPVKGVHQLFKALPLIISHCPQVTVRIAGVKQADGVVKRIVKAKGYSRYLSRLAHELSIKEHITFLGPLNAEQMKSEYLRANLFISPSTIENSPNSLGEAQILGVPCLSSYVGGAMDMIPNESCGQLYRFEDVEVLAYKVCDIFKQSALFDNSKMRKDALLRHDPRTNSRALYSIYLSILTH